MGVEGGGWSADRMESHHFGGLTRWRRIILQGDSGLPQKGMAARPTLPPAARELPIPR